MKSLTKQDSKRTLKGRTNSSLKMGRPLTSRSGGQPLTLLSKSTIIKQLSNKDKVINNFMYDINRSQKMIKANRCNAQKRITRQKVYNKNVYEQYLMKNSDKMKLLYWNDGDEIRDLQKIVISADYIINQDHFWDNQPGKADQEKNMQSYKQNKNTQDGQLAKNWKFLHKYYYVIWVIRKKNSLKKMQQIITNNSLPLHAIFYIKRKKNYTIDYTPVIKEMQKENIRKSEVTDQNVYANKINQQFIGQVQRQSFNIFEIIKTNTKDNIDYHSFFGRVPVILQRKANVYFLRVETEPPGLELIVKCLQKVMKENHQLKGLRYKPHLARGKPLQTYILLIIRTYISDYISKHNLKQKQRQTFTNYNATLEWQYNQQDIELKLSTLKKSLIDYFIEQYGRNYQFQGGSSIYNFVGQMFKRNYKILYTSILQEMQIQRRKHHKMQSKGWDKEQICLNLQLEYYEMS